MTAFLLDQGDTDSDGDPTPDASWSGPPGYVFIVDADGFILFDDDPMTLLLLP